MAVYYANSTQIWVDWAQTTATSASSTQIWVDWLGTPGMETPISSGWTAPYQPPTPEQVARSRAEAARVNALGRQQAQEREAVSRKARELLLANLSRSQRREFLRCGWFHVIKGSRAYQLGPGRQPLRVRGGQRLSYCIHPVNWYPPEDVTLAHKLLLDADEGEFLRIANASAA